jgi:hypothetical protein
MTVRMGTATILSDGESLRICTSCPEPHFENCDECFGFGLKVGVTMPLALVNAAEAFDGTTAEPRPCPACGSIIIKEIADATN